ncbi:D-alanyl-D-alanine carboxypeptidase/D-alanyl-D-alanine endopeptidase [Litoreibacter roseus]|uniref:D-alanyl-D-alanine carboxypeptidase n=1 Tax=Litoreibacter roseus TaxID=2601869 RepID=A0A6N6JA74_9RHOB|nr:D-alanyl-D-alanine carboxypeptidase/D-alanyl-D-alanine-endopeptidase [Litoreibacter roseus]GFE63006.1 D-alanyl-D-alanine carboxypeptidase [Litoreibacter roseus]
MASPPHIRPGRRTVLAFLLFGAADAALTGPALAKTDLTRSDRPRRRPEGGPQRIIPAAEELIEAARLGGKTSCVVADAKTGEILEAVRPLAPHPPASVSKAITALYALNVLGPDHRFRTRLRATGPVEDGVIQGDLVLEGGGDPVLDSDDLFDMAGRLKEAGVLAIRGDFLVFGNGLPTVARIDAGQPEHVGYNPAISGLNLNFNRVYLEWKRQGTRYQVSMDARTNRIRPSVTIAHTQVVDRRTPVFGYRDAGVRDEWSVARGALGNGGGRWLPVRRPEIYAGDVFQTVARSHGLVLPYPKRVTTRPAGTVLVEHTSSDVRAICRGMLKYSTNLTAEVLGMSASRMLDDVMDLGGSARAMQEWLRDKYDTPRAHFVDHSGLGDQSSMTAQQMVKALVGAERVGMLRPLLKNIPMKDRDPKIILDKPPVVVAKTGTLNFVNALAGYITAPDGRDLVFAIFSSDLPRRAALTVDQKERPRGGRSWNGRARLMQRELIRRWCVLDEI